MPIPRAFRLVLVPFSALALTACAATPPVYTSPAPAERPFKDWAFETSDIPLDPGFVFGTLDNGMRYVIRRNATPPGTGLVRMEIETGALDEDDAERGFAHFVEHMAFNGSTNVPEGEMVRLLERDGLAFGADTNASTGFDRTTYMLDLPRNDPALLDTALMLMRETASELTFDPAAVARERGVVLAEMRDRNTYALRNAIDETRFLHPDARYPQRFPIGTAETIGNATAPALKAFWRREYVPAKTTLVVIGDFDPAQVEARIRERFSNWPQSSSPRQPTAGPIDLADGGRTAVYIDPALPERVLVTRSGPWLYEPDSVAQRQENLLRRIGYAILNRRLLSVSRQADGPFQGAGFGTGDIFEAGRATRLIVDTPDRKWKQGLTVAALAYRRALKFGFAEAEVAEQVAEIRNTVENAAASQDTRSNAELLNAVWALLREEDVPSLPATVLERFEEFAPSITPVAVLAALEREAVPLKDPLIRFRGRTAPEGGADAVRAAWDAAMKTRLSRDEGRTASAFTYTDFGSPGTIVSDTRATDLDIREVRFANGVRLNLKHTDIERDTVRVSVNIDGGEKLDTRETPLATQMVPYLDEGGLGRHSLDELDTLLAGRTVSRGVQAGGDTFVTRATTTPRDLELQLQLIAAYLTDPGYRPEALTRYRRDINRYFAQIDATPSSALNARISGIVTDDDPRFALLDPARYRALTLDDLKTSLGDRLAHGAIEIGIVGDVDEDAAIALVGRTLGALPAREADFRDYSAQPTKTFTADRSLRVLRHDGADDQALIYVGWPTRDDSDPVETMGLEVLERVVRIAMTETLREKLGKAYSPGVSSSSSRTWPGYGTFGISASVDVANVPETRAAIAEAIRAIRADGPDDDTLARARQPMLERYQNALKSNAGWLALVDRAQSEPDRIERFERAPERLMAITPAQIQALSRTYLSAQPLTVLVLPRNAPEP